MRNLLLAFLTLFAFSFSNNSVIAQCSKNTSSVQKVKVNAKSMASHNNIVETLLGSKKHTTLVAAVKAADLVGTLQGDGPFTVFAPVNDAFENLPEGTVSTLLKPENKNALTKILTYHVVAGKFDAKSVVNAIKQGHGVAKLTTVSGGILKAKMNGERNVVLEDESGNIASISTYDINQSNGIIHVIDTVVLPK